MVTNPKLTVFISYVHEDGGISDALNNALRNAFGEQVGVFVDKVSIQQGENIRDTITDNLTKSDMLVVVSTGTDRPSHDWAGFELGYFDAKHTGANAERPEWGSIVIFCSQGSAPSSETHRNYIELGVAAELFEKTEEQFAEALNVADDDPLMLWFGRLLKAITGDDLAYMQGKRDTYRAIIKDFKRKVFAELKMRPKRIFQPQRKLVIRYDIGKLQPPNVFSPDTTITLTGGASSVFGTTGITDGKAFKWAEFCENLKPQSLAQFWIGALVRMLLHFSVGDNINVDNGQLVSSYDQRKLFRLILTSSTTYYNNFVDASIYMIEVYKRQDFGDPETSALVRALQLVTRFRFLFLEEQSEFYYLNVQLRRDVDLGLLASRIVSELDILNSDALEADLHMPGSWRGVLSEEQIRNLNTVWLPLNDSLIEDCRAALAAVSVSDKTSARSKLGETLEQIRRQVYPLNSEMLASIADKLLKIAKRNGAEGEGIDT